MALPPTPSSAEVKDRAELYLDSLSLFLGLHGLLQDELHLFTQRITKQLKHVAECGLSQTSIVSETNCNNFVSEYSKGARTLAFLEPSVYTTIDNPFQRHQTLHYLSF